MAQVVVTELVPEGEGDDLVEHLVGARDAARVDEGLRRQDAERQERAPAVLRDEPRRDGVDVRVVGLRSVDLVGRLGLRDSVDGFEETLGRRHERRPRVVAAGEGVDLVRVRVEDQRDGGDAGLVLGSKIRDELLDDGA